MKVGRPREVENPVRVSVRVSASDYDRIDRIARDSGTSVPAVIRSAISVLQSRSPRKPAAH
jgi:predicted transcriptional regulator